MPSTVYPHIEIDASGGARIAGTRYKVAYLAAEHYHYGWSAEELMRQHPDLRPEQVYAALTYFYDHQIEIMEQLARRDEIISRFEDSANSPALSRAELIKRREQKGT